MNLDELAPRPNSKKLAEVASKTFGYSVDLKTLDLPKAQQIKETFANKLKKLDETLGAKVVSDKRYYEAKLVVETVDQFIREYNDGMSDEAHELVLFGENDGDLYNQRTVPIQKNLTKKWDKGVYDHDLAVKLWKYWADDAAMRYAKMHGSPNIKWSNMFSVADRMQAAEYMADNWEEELEAGNKMESVETVEESVIVEGEMEAAEVVMAARSIVDRIQGMLEDLGEIMNEDVPPLTDTITDQMGADMAAQFSTAVNGAVQAALDAVTQARAGADAAARMLTGESAPMMGEPAPEEMPMEPTTDMEMDMEQPIEEPAEEGDEIATADAAQGGDEALGRARR